MCERNIVVPEDTTVADEDELLRLWLGNQYSIERIVVVPRK